MTQSASMTESRTASRTYLAGEPGPERLEITPSADLSVSTTYVALPPSGCLNGCHAGAGDARRPVETEGSALLCRSCTKRLDSWLRAIPDLYALLPHVIDHGTVAGNPENVRAKNPDPPAPMRLEILDMLDQRQERGVLGILDGWAEVIRDERHLPRHCTCSHPEYTHSGNCTTPGCGCMHYAFPAATVVVAVRVIVQHLAWATEQDWIIDLYAELKTLHRQLRDAVGEYRTHPVGTCKAQPIGQGEAAVCGGPLFMEREGHAVACASCGNRQEADHGLRELGLKIGLIDENGNTKREAS